MDDFGLKPPFMLRCNPRQRWAGVCRSYGVGVHFMQAAYS